MILHNTQAGFAVTTAQNVLKEGRNACKKFCRLADPVDESRQLRSLAELLVRVRIALGNLKYLDMADIEIYRDIALVEVTLITKLKEATSSLQFDTSRTRGK